MTTRWTWEFDPDPEAYQPEQPWGTMTPPRRWGLVLMWLGVVVWGLLLLWLLAHQFRGL